MEVFMATRISFKAKKSMGVIYIMIPVFLLFLMLVTLATGSSTIVGPGGLSIIFLILGIWYLKAELVTFESDIVRIKLALLGKKHEIPYKSVKSIDTDKKNQIILAVDGKPIKLYTTYFSKEDSETILSELKKRTGKK